VDAFGKRVVNVANKLWHWPLTAIFGC